MLEWEKDLLESCKDLAEKVGDGSYTDLDLFNLGLNLGKLERSESEAIRDETVGIMNDVYFGLSEFGLAELDD